METMIKEFKENIKVLIENGRTTEAKALLEEYKKIEKDDVDIYSMNGIIAMMEGRMDDAESAFKAGIEVDENNFDMLYNLGYLYQSVEQKELATEHYKKAFYSAKSEEQENEARQILKVLGVDDIKEKKVVERQWTESLDKREIVPHNETYIKNSNHKETEQKCFKEESPNVEVFFNIPIERELINNIKNRNYNRIIEVLKDKVSIRDYKEVASICSYWLEHVGESTGIIYYFIGIAANGLKDFKNAEKYHKKALELDISLADLRNKKTKYKHAYFEEKTCCIGCGDNNYEIVNVSNQSISEDNKGLINPIRRWVRCDCCGLIYANPIPAEKQLNEYYSLIAKEKFGGIYGNIDNRFEFLVSMANKRLEKIEKYTGGVKKILDIGTGVGIFTGIALDRGWDAEGVEFTPEDCEYAKDNFGLELKQENFYDFKKDIKFDVVTLFEVIEHLQHPLEDLKQINKLIKDDGFLVIATPIQDSLFGKKMKEKNIFWNVVTHLSYFTKQVMVNYIENAGFEVIEISFSNEGMGRMEFYCRKVAKRA